MLTTIREPGFDLRDPYSFTVDREQKFKFVAAKDVEQESSVSKSSSARKTLWRTFWFCQIIGLCSLLSAEFIGNADLKLVPHLKFLGLGLILVALECVFLARLSESKRMNHGEEDCSTR